MKRALTLVLAVLMLTFTAVGCGNGSPSGGGTSSDSSSSSDNAPATPDKVYEFKFSTQGTPGSANLQTIYDFAEDVKQATNGGVIIEVYHSSMLGSDRETMENIQIGTIEMGKCQAGTMANFFPIAGALALPYLVKDFDEIKEFVEGDVGRYIMGKVDESDDIIPLVLLCDGIRQLWTSTKPVYTLEDFAGIKLRVQQSDIYIATFEALGAYPIGLAASESIIAVQQGTVDGNEGTSSTQVAAGYWEFTKYISATNHIAGFGFIIMNRNVFNSLPKEYQEAILDCAKALAEAQYEGGLTESQTYLDIAIERGLTYNDISKEELGRMAAVCREKVWTPYFDEFKEFFALLGYNSPDDFK